MSVLYKLRLVHVPLFCCNYTRPTILVSATQKTILGKQIDTQRQVQSRNTKPNTDTHMYTCTRDPKTHGAEMSWLSLLPLHIERNIMPYCIQYVWHCIIYVWVNWKINKGMYKSTTMHIWFIRSHVPCVYSMWVLRMCLCTFQVCIPCVYTYSLLYVVCGTLLHVLQKVCLIIFLTTLHLTNWAHTWTHRNSRDIWVIIDIIHDSLAHTNI